MPCVNGIWSVGGRNWNEDFEMLADDCNCTGRFGVDAFCLALHGAAIVQAIHIVADKFSNIVFHILSRRNTDIELR